MTATHNVNPDAFSRRDFLKTAGAGALAAVAMPSSLVASESNAKRPNVILVMTDDQGYGDLACHGHPYVQTPYIDRLYEDSIRLTDFHVSPTCSPTRASLMTGRYNNRAGVWHTIMGRSLLRRDEVTMADVFANSGYRTAIFGKWHLGDNYPFRPEDRGFHESLVHRGGGIGQGLDYWGNDYFDDTYFRNSEPEKFEGYCTDVWFREALKFIETNKDRPFFCYIPTNAAHGPFLVDEKYSRPYMNKAENSEVARMYGMITNIDENMGRLMRRLDEMGLSDNTILIFTTDNGSSFGEEAAGFSAGMRANKGSYYDGGHRVPFFIRWPKGGMKGGRDMDRITAHIDVLPSLIEICGLNKPSNVQFDGQSLAPLLIGATTGWPERVIITDSQRVDHPIKWRRSAVMSDRWRLINGEELYDIKSDPHQDHDIADRHPDVVKNLRAEYEDWWDSVSQRFDEYCELVIGAPEENPTCLMSHDIHGKVVWNHGQVREGDRADGFWAVEVARDGNYRFALRRWPREVNRPINREKISIHRTSPNFGEIQVTNARLKVANFDGTLPVHANDHEVVFDVPLKAGKTRVQAWFNSGLGDGLTHGTYYVYVERV